MFRAALYTGMPITARRNHSYAVSYYARPNGYGLDATVYDPNPDFRFKNDTQGAILIQGYVQGNDAYFVFYGTNDGRTVQMEGPFVYGTTSIVEPVITYTDKLAPGVRELTEYAHKGFQVDWFRTITRADGTKSERENIHSNYEARPAKYLEGQPAEVVEVAEPVEPTTR
jgi:vancomycin resistance protein YoaR